jgi:hypothetical protein
VKQENEREENADASSPEDPVKRENNPCIEYLRQAIVRLLMKNEIMRYELFSISRKIAVIDQAVFGAGSSDLRKRLPPYFVDAVHDLCRCEAAARHEERPPHGQSSEKVLSFRTRQAGD